MKRILRTSSIAVAVLLLAGLATAPVRGQDLSQPVLLVASSLLDGTPFEQAVAIAVPLPSGGHIGFIVNKPTKIRLDALFPDDADARKVQEPVYLGGPGLFPAVFALTKTAPEDAALVVPMLPGLVAVLDEQSVDHVIQGRPNDARYFVGAILWENDELEQQVSGNAWEVHPADATIVLRANTRGLWNTLRRPMA